MSASSHIKSLAVVEESSFGSLDATTNLPDSTIFATPLYIEAERADLVTPGEIAMNDREEARSQFYVLPPEPETVCDSLGARVDRRTGTLSFTTTLRTGGDFNSLGNGYDNSAISLLLASAMQDGSSPAAAADYTVSATGGVDANNFLVAGGDGALFTIGDIIAVDINGKREYSAVTDIQAGASDTISHSPAFSAAITTEVIRTCRTYSTSKGSVGASVAFQVEGDGWLSRCYGCRWETLEFSLTGRRLMLTWTFQCALIQDDHSFANPGDPTRLRGKVTHFFPSDVVLSSAVPQPVLGTPASTPFALSQDLVADVDEFSATITNVLAPKGYSQSILAVSDWEVADRTIEVTLTLSSVSTTVEDDFKDQVQRTLVVGFGPTGDGNGACLLLGSAVLQSDPNLRDVSADIVRQVLTYGAGFYQGDASGGGTATNTPIRFGLSH